MESQAKLTASPQVRCGNLRQNPLVEFILRWYDCVYSLP